MNQLELTGLPLHPVGCEGHLRSWAKDNPVVERQPTYIKKSFHTRLLQAQMSKPLLLDIVSSVHLFLFISTFYLLYLLGKKSKCNGGSYLPI